ncbi:hypothetical protein P368_07560 [Comamonas thiooxydans]|uniref:Uncharacterized protein n=1 Tax=Comamonas testosteroni TK102 TaxID=1392005 RepID=A0A076PZ73_COMTE|nr:hypothetical protein O987_23245 [Comamonas testosteroni TK102]KGH14001.1 hypothetical protein P368_07560 [Comamonas thiooxydans]
MCAAFVMCGECRAFFWAGAEQAELMESDSRKRTGSDKLNIPVV